MTGGMMGQILKLRKKKDTSFFLLVEGLQKNGAGTGKVASKEKEV